MTTIRHTDEQAGITGRVRTGVHDTTLVRYNHPEWDALPRDAKAAIIHERDPERRSTTTNSLLNEWLEHIVDLMDQTQTGTAEEVSHFAVGTDSTAADPTDTGLGSEVARTTIDTETDNGTDFDASGFLDSNQANGNTLREVALATDGTQGSGLEVNRAIISAVDKDDTKLVTVSFTIRHSNA